MSKENEKDELANVPEFIYKLDKILFTEIKNYLNTRPIGEVDWFFKNIFDLEYDSTYQTFEGIQRVMEYLVYKCPRREVRYLVRDMTADGGILKFQKNPPVEEKKS
jgi:hypothetical protein